MATLIEVDSDFLGKRFAYDEAEPHELNFTTGIRVQPAQYHNYPNYYFEFVRRHEPGEPMWSHGGYECREIDRENSWLSKSRAFHLDALIVHSSLYKNLKPNIKNTTEHGNTESSSKETKEGKGTTI